MADARIEKPGKRVFKINMGCISVDPFTPAMFSSAAEIDTSIG